MEEYAKFIQTNEFEEFFINSLLYAIEKDNTYLKNDYNKLGDDLFFKLREINYKIIEILAEFTHTAKSLKIESLIEFIKDSNFSRYTNIWDIIHPLFIANLDKFVLLKCSKSMEISLNEIVNYKLNIDVVYSHENMLKVDKAKAVMELFTNKSTTNIKTLDKQENSLNERNIYELGLEDLENLIAGLKELYANIN
jgi:hypothetical protein